MDKLIDLKRYNGLYKIDEYGNIFGTKRNNIRKWNTSNKKGYAYITLCKNGKHKTEKIHRLVAENFIKDFSNNLQVNHKDGNKLNNHFSNLEMCTNNENAKHSSLNFLNGNKLSKNQIIEIINLEGMMLRKDIAKKYNVCKQTITNILNKNTHKALWGEITNDK